MQLSNIPAKILAIFAASGIKNTVPLLDTEIAQPYNASYDVGFPPITMEPIPSGGLPPDGADINGMFSAITAVSQWLNAGGVFPYDAAFSAQIGGYPKGAFLLQAIGTGFWQSTVDNNTTDPDTSGAGWVNPITITGVPTGSIFQFPATAAPTGYLIAQGQLVSRVTYAALWAYAQTTGNIVADGSWTPGNFSTGDGSTTFRLPQYGGYFLRSQDNGNGIDPSRVLGSTQVGENGSHNHTASSTVSDPGHHHVVPSSPGTGQGAAGINSVQQNTGTVNTTTVGTGISVGTTINNSGGTETRPINISVLVCIKI